MYVGAFVLALSTALLLAAPTSARGEVPVDGGRKVESAVFRADKSGGGAWVEVTLGKRFLSGKDARQRGVAVAVGVPGLSFDKANGKLGVVSADGRSVTCAVLGESVEATGECRIDAKIEEVTVDTGFGAKTGERLVVDVSPR